MSSYNNKNIYKRLLYCPNCKNINVLWSRKSRIRPVGHIKTMYCYFCGQLQNLIEMKEELAMLKEETVEGDSNLKEEQKDDENSNLKR